ncbi:methyl-accepting chemotaxis protein [Noviherbaspirillum saxi]|uniref:Methyl-accepting chemotaxis protein n=1 Tax=Noviherbaspirillum saxi TaxID=2320863 RepID=A0A3A3FUS8_9BURK|nr:methyl-accepting chemotaxis protein [Noviherbaspirillum saxi]RJF99320.1 methyl-accepting chemotaxis protein [Noviherbaspirillum saxi]
MSSLAIAKRPDTATTTGGVKISGEVFAAMINLSGRRRFTSQRLVLYAVLASLSHDDAVATARSALKLFEDAHVALVDEARKLPDDFSGELKNAYFGTPQADRNIRDFASLAQRALTAIESGARQAPALLDELVRGATPMLAVLNQLTQIYEDLSKRHALHVRKHLHGIMNDIESIARQARMVSFNAQIVAARAGHAGREFSVVAGVLSDITGEIDGLVHEALNSSVA